MWLYLTLKEKNLTPIFLLRMEAIQLFTGRNCLISYFKIIKYLKYVINHTQNTDYETCINIYILKHR